ncbi:penicillin-binding protein 1A [Oxalobacter aliiformigenes]|uniref:Penicillin-binding protein 1A n=1 Tax=Oxalobacter aliiformigenes TaxID=2946593 RepID=A0ABY7JHT4_9BURK|nr:penicillin-binding protein 1A [Oxalobacter aliiformigenes]WAV93321.1 penicillin-binding protein 1A [Oxalobacter aliiformigenes]WAV95179.1 penicillin-binding protein 1A [Oxalobacter aliiformigenes]WAV97021.1 penicillin-binding protein 1A [Oxalobacter aliiformigenes]
MFNKNQNPDQTSNSPRKKWLARLLVSCAALGTGVVLIGALIVILAMTLIYPKLPPMDQLTDYHPKMPLRIYTADHVLMGEFGEERRNLVRINKIPDIMKKAVLAIEDDRFYQHSGVDYIGILRAALHNLVSNNRQGASTITQQVARNFFLTSEQTFKRKLYEVLLAWKIERTLTKDQILEIYLNQIYLGQRAFGFASAAQVYFGKPLQDITLAEAAMLAGLPKAPSANNPITNPTRAKQRQQYILLRMKQLGYVTDQEYEKAKNEEIKVKTSRNEFSVHAQYVAEMVRMMVYDQYKDETYTRGLNVYTTITQKDQEAAYQAVRRGVMDYDKRHGYRGPEGYMEIPAARDAIADAIEDELAKYPDSDGILSAVVLEASPGRVRAVLSSGNEISVTGNGLNFAASGLTSNAGSNKQIRRGSIIRLAQDIQGNWNIVQMPQIEAAFVSLNPNDGAIKSLIGGFDFTQKKFNHVTQAWRQPGSSFKPFIYSASLDKNLAPASIINDAPVSFSGQTNGQTWTPKNFDSKYEGPITMRRGLMKSKNMISIQILNQIGAQYGQEFITRFGFDPDKNPPYLTLALGAGSVTPLQMATAYSVFANGGYKIRPYIISHITDSDGKILSQARPEKAGDESNRVIDARNAFIMDTLLKDVVRGGTAARANILNRPDLAGKTGTTNDSIDAWFAGYQPSLVAVAWLGFDQPRNMGGRETGSALALPVWISYMQKALSGIPVEMKSPPAGVIYENGDYYYTEAPPGKIVTNIGVGQKDYEKIYETENNNVKDEIFADRSSGMLPD